MRSPKRILRAQTASAAPIEYIGIFVAVIMAVGSAFAAMNTMLRGGSAALGAKSAPLRVLGFSKGSILLSFFLESVLLSGLGGVLGCLLVSLETASPPEIGNSISRRRRSTSMCPGKSCWSGWRLRWFWARLEDSSRHLTRQEGNPHGVAGNLSYGRGTEDLQIDRNKRRSAEPSKWATRWIIVGVLILLFVGRVAIRLGEVQSGAGGGRAARQIDQRGQRARGRDTQRDRLHYRPPTRSK